MITEYEIPPSIPERDIVEKYRFVPGGSGSSSREYDILPDGNFDIAFLLSETRSYVFLAGPYTEKTTVPLNGFELFAVRFRAGVIPDMTDVKSSELVNSMVVLPSVFGMGADSVCDMLVGNNHPDARQGIVEHLLRKRNIQSGTQQKLYRRATSVIEQCGGRIQVQEVADHLGVSRRTLERHFMEVLGFPPKQFIRLIRFQKAIALIKHNDPCSSLTRVAYDSGYSDQSHFIRDFRLLSGESPRFFRK